MAAGFYSNQAGVKPDSQNQLKTLALDAVCNVMSETQHITDSFPET